MLAESQAAKESKAVTNPGGGTGQHKSLPPNVAYTDNDYQAKKQARVIQTCKSVQRAAAGDFLVQHTGEQSKVHADDIADDIGNISHIKICKQGLNSKIEQHDPERTAGLQLLNAFAVFICTNSTHNGEEEDAGDRGQKHTGECDAQQHNG